MITTWASAMALVLLLTSVGCTEVAHATKSKAAAAGVSSDPTMPPAANKGASIEGSDKQILAQNSETAASAISPQWGERTAVPDAKVHAESSALTIAGAAVKSCDLPAAKITTPTVSVEDFGAKGDGVTDDTDAINKAIDSLKNGGTVQFAKGKTYVKRKNIIVKRTGVQLWGYGATLYVVTTDPELRAGKGVAQLSVQLLAPHTGIYGFTITSNVRRRLIGHPNEIAIYIGSDHQEIADNRIEYTVGGIMAEGASNFLVARNVVYRTYADGIHVTQKSRSGKILCNVVRETGDDMIAIVNYGVGEPTIGNFLIEGNDVADQFWGRGITVVGGKDVTIRGNKISGTSVGAGILINTETYWHTADVHNVLVEGNHISHVQTIKAPYNPTTKDTRTGQGGIDINGQGTQRVADVLVRNNTIEDAVKDGVYLRGNSCRIGLVGNSMQHVGGAGIRIDSNVSPDCFVGCSENTKDGAPAMDPKCGTSLPTVTGASL